MANDPIDDDRDLLISAYREFNERNIDRVLALMRPDVVWPNGMEGGTVDGHDGVRAYWTRQWTLIDPYVEPLSFEQSRDRVKLTVPRMKQYGLISVEAD